MSIKEKVDNFVYKVNDMIYDAKCIFEKSCVELICFSLGDLRKNTKCKCLIDYDKKEISFSGSLDIACKDIPKPWVFITPSAEVIELDENTIEQTKEEVQLKTKSENHVITKAKFDLKTIKLI